MGKRTVYLAHPVLLRLREADENGAQPVDMMGQPLKDRKGADVPPFKISEHHYKRGANLMPDEHANHPYIKAASVDPKLAGAPEFTVDQLQAMLAEAQAREGAGGDKKEGGMPEGFTWPDDDAIAALDYQAMGALLAQRGLAVPQKKDDRMNLIIDTKAADTAGQ